jgi:hypothetical protein
MGCRKIENVINSVAVHRLQRMAPEEYQFARQIATPTITDLTLIPEIVQFVIGNGYTLNGENTPFILAVVYKLVAEYKLYYQALRLPPGMRDIISLSMQYKSPEMISMAGSTLIGYYKGNWANKVNEMAAEFLNTISKIDDNGKKE